MCFLAKDEGPTIDFKSTAIRLDSEYHKAEVVKDIICMANTPRQGSADIVYGVARKPDGTKEIVGISSHPDDANLQTLLGGKVNPIPMFHYISAAYDGKSLGILEVFPRRIGPYIPKMEYGNALRHGIIYFRRGSSNEEAQPDEIRDIVNWMSDRSLQGGQTGSTPNGPRRFPLVESH